MDVARRPSVNKSGSVRDGRMKSDHLQGGNATGDHIQPEGHLQHSPVSTGPSNKAPVPIRSTRRKWSQPTNDNSDQIAAKPASSSSLRKTRSDVVGDANSSPRMLRKVKSTADGSAKPARLAVVEDPESLEADKLSDGSGIGSQIKHQAVAGESLDPCFDMITFPIEKDVYATLECQETLISCSSANANGNQFTETADFDVDEKDKEEADEVDEKSVEEGEEIGTKEKSYDVKEVTVPDKKTLQDGNNEDDANVSQISDRKAAGPTTLEVKQPPRVAYVKRSAFYSDFNKLNHSVSKASTNVSKPTPNPNYSKSGSKFTTPSPNVRPPAASMRQPHEFQRHPDNQNRLQSLVDLVMWRDVSRSAFVFGTGTFMIISSSYTQDLNISFISITSYLGLAYLAMIFLLRSILHREAIHVVDVILVGEEEAIWIVKLVLPYVNEFYLSLRALFSGDPATTMKLAVVLFFLARCGSSITIWNMAKLGFIGVFTVPKAISSYSVQLKTQGKFWTERFRDAWDSCTHKKIIAGIIFSLIWNLCSVVARIWVVFMVAVVFRYYQQTAAVNEEWEVEDGAEDDVQQRRGVEDSAIKEKKLT